MRFAVLAFAAVYLAGLADAQKQSLPQCSLECLNDLLPKSACAPTNQTCICTDADFQEQLETCVSENCTIKESLTTLNVTNTGCGAPIRDQTSPSIIIPAVGLGVLLFVGLRIYTRVVVTEANLGLDDWATILLGCCIVPVNVGSILLGKAGLGKDIWTLEFGSITRILYLYYIQELLYIFCVSLTKICFLLFYLRIFPSAQTRKVITISGIITICYCIAFMIALAFQCFPISYNWNAWDGEHTGKCVKKNTLVIAAAGLNIVLDAWVIALPIPRILNLQASISTKLQVVIMFSVGFLITGVSIYRTIMLKIFATSTNATCMPTHQEVRPRPKLINAYRGHRRRRLLVHHRSRRRGLLSLHARHTIPARPHDPKCFRINQRYQRGEFRKPTETSKGSENNKSYSAY